MQCFGPAPNCSPFLCLLWILWGGKNKEENRLVTFRSLLSLVLQCNKKGEKINYCWLDPASPKPREQASTVLSFEALETSFSNTAFFIINGYNFATSDRQKVASMCICFSPGHESIVCMGHICSGDVTTLK